MCGICGFLKLGGVTSSQDGVTIERMNQKLIHRGPDDQVTLLDDHLALGFSRLSIIGVSNGKQPIFNEDRSVVLICNGEIFNYIELREFLRQKGHAFSTESDVEVIIHLYEDYGPEFLNKLNGQFAFALFDYKRKLFFCARDHFGVAPFFYTVAGDTFIFGSEIKAILEHPRVKAEVDMTGLDQVFTFPGLISPRTMFKNISSLPNGHYLTIDGRGDITVNEYWDLTFVDGRDIEPRTEEYFIEQFDELFDNSVRLRQRSEVPLGIYLSGGLDSSIIAGKVHQLDKTSRRNAFSIDFIDSHHSESFYQDMVARHNLLDHHKKTFFYDDIMQRLRGSVYHSECPLKETYNTASMALSESVRSRGIKVVLSGEGADEFFAGYVGYRFDKMREMNLVTSQLNGSEGEVCDNLWGDRSFFYERNFLDFEVNKKSIYGQTFRESFDEFNCLNHFIVNKKRLQGLPSLNKRTYIDYKLRLVDHLVADHGDRMALANSVEARYPFLDKSIVEFAASLPPELKLNDFTEKYILRKFAAHVVPPAILEREKFHFIAPGSPYLLQKNIAYVNDLLSYDRIKRQGYFDPDAIETLKNTYRQPGFKINAPYESDLLIIVLTFEILLETFFEK